MRLSAKILCLMCLLGMICLISCGQNTEVTGGVRVTPEMLESVSRSLVEATATEPSEDTQPTTAVSEMTESTVSVDGTPDVVYWTESGSVYHVTAQCSSLRHSAQILHGSVEEAMAAKKERPCKSCS